MTDYIPKAVFFDWDGTLADTAQMVLDAHNHVRALYNKPAIGMDDIFGRITKSAREAFPDIYGAEDARDAEEALYKFIREQSGNYLKPLPGAQELLEFLKDAGIAAGIVSNKRHEGLEREIAALGWQPLIAMHVGAGQASEDKPSAAPLLLALERLGGGLTPADIFYVGDTEADLLCARNAGSPCIFVPHAHGKRELAAVYQPLYMFETLDELRSMLAERVKKRA